MWYIVRCYQFTHFHCIAQYIEKTVLPFHMCYQENRYCVSKYNDGSSLYDHIKSCSCCKNSGDFSVAVLKCLNDQLEAKLMEYNLFNSRKSE